MQGFFHKVSVSGPKDRTLFGLGIFDLNNKARASVNAESLCIPISQIQ